MFCHTLYPSIIRRLTDFLQGGSKEVQKEIEREMKRAAVLS